MNLLLTVIKISEWLRCCRSTVSVTCCCCCEVVETKKINNIINIKLYSNSNN